MVPAFKSGALHLVAAAVIVGGQPLGRGLAAWLCLSPVVDRVFPFEEAPGAYRYFESLAYFGKVVISHG